jgi:two-component system sensor histidine kinase UhpB
MPMDQRMRARTLLTQVLAVNTALVALTAAVAAVVASDRVEGALTGRGLLLLALAVASVVLLNSVLLRRRLAPVACLVARMAEVELASVGEGRDAPRGAARELRALTAGFEGMLARLQEERREAGLLVLRAQEQERGRLARDLHDEVNQALTAILLRLQATLADAPPALRHELGETKRLVNQAMEELLHIARHLRPAALDDHGLVAALAATVEHFGHRGGPRASFACTGTAPAPLGDEQQLVLYRVCQESLANVAQHARANRVEVELALGAPTVLRVRDDGCGFDGERAEGDRGRGRAGGLGLSGMRERALLAGARLDVDSRPGAGTTVELTLP